MVNFFRKNLYIFAQIFKFPFCVNPYYIEFYFFFYVYYNFLCCLSSFCIKVIVYVSVWAR